MVITKPFVFVHVPKTGGTWLRERLKRWAPVDWKARVISNRHEPWRALTRQERLRPCFWGVRNPWDWHVSNYHFWTGHHRDHTGGYALPPERWTPEEQWWARINYRGLGFRKALPLVIAARQTESAYIDLLCRDEDGQLQGQPLRFEGWRSNVAGHLRELGVKLPAKLVRDLRNSPPVMTSRHACFSSYYTPELIRLVAQAEELLLQPPFNYEWKDP